MSQTFLFLKRVTVEPFPKSIVSITWSDCFNDLEKDEIFFFFLEQFLSTIFS